MSTRSELEERVDSWLEQRLDGQGAFRQGDVVEEGVSELMSEPKIVRKAADSLLRSYFVEKVHRRVRDSRQKVAVGDSVVDTDDPEGSASILSDDAEDPMQWMEYNGEEYVPVPEATRSDLDEAISRRVQQTAGQLTMIAALDQLRSPLDEGDRVRDHFSDEEIASVLSDSKRMVRDGGTSADRLIEAATAS